MTAQITTIAGLSFAVSDGVGDVTDDGHGVFVRDTRHLSRFELLVDGVAADELGAHVDPPDLAHFRCCARPEGAIEAVDPPLEVARVRQMAVNGFTEHITLNSWGVAPFELSVAMRLDADLRDIFEVRSFDATSAPVAVTRIDPGRGIRFTSADGVLATVVRFDPPADRIDDDRATWRPQIAPGQPWTLSIEVVAEPRDTPPKGPEPDRTAAPAIASDPADLARAVRASLADFGALTLPDPLSGARRLITAGIPWYVALFGRDSLIASHQARLFDSRRVVETLGALAARQGTVADDANDEAPGKILHEVRLTPRPWLGSGTADGSRPYFGTIDATPLFLIMVGQAWRWGAAREDISALLPAAEAALSWLRGPHADRDGDGFIEHPSGTGRRLVNQGWKDSPNAIQFPDGTCLDGPIALVEVQGYAVRARREMAAVLAAFGDDTRAAEIDAEADAFAARIREEFWVPGLADTPGHFALALDGHKRRSEVVSSNMAHLLWCDIPTEAQAAEVARHLVSPEMASGWGLRTLSRATGGFNPISYHLGSVWPHDTHIAIEGLRRYSFDTEALLLTGQLLDALAAFDGRLPELFGGHAREELGFPVPYPTACRPQAWAAGVPPALIATLLGIEPDIPNRTIALAPRLPPGLTRLRVEGIRFPTGDLSVEVGASGVEVVAAPAQVRVEITAQVSPPGTAPRSHTDAPR
jgi:glycogen debranching enzyme